MTEITVRLSQDSPDPYTPSAIFGPGADNYLESLSLRSVSNLPCYPCRVDARDEKGGARYELLPFDVYGNSLSLNPAGLWR